MRSGYFPRCWNLVESHVGINRDPSGPSWRQCGHLSGQRTEFRLKLATGNALSLPSALLPSWRSPYLASCLSFSSVHYCTQGIFFSLSLLSSSQLTFFLSLFQPLTINNTRHNFIKRSLKALIGMTYTQNSYLVIFILYSCLGNLYCLKCNFNLNIVFKFWRIGLNRFPFWYLK